MKKYKFDKDLIEGTITSRPNRFIMMVKLGSKIIECHCPATGRIGNIKFDNISCLLSESNNNSRRTKYTVEAISLDDLSKKNKSWVGINQNKINRYVEFCFWYCKILLMYLSSTFA
jgi:sugar fermentation stimulation protein A